MKTGIKISTIGAMLICSFSSSHPLIEESHYYPFSSTMAGTTYRALNFGGPQNKLKFSGKEEQLKEFENYWIHLGLDLVDFGVRMYDQQIERWNSINPLSDKMRRFSSNNYVFDYPVTFIDPDGIAPNGHIFNKYGTFILDTKKGDKVMIQDGNTLVELSTYTNRLLAPKRSALETLSNWLEAVNLINKVGTFYGNKAGVKGDVTIDISNSTAPLYTKSPAGRSGGSVHINAQHGIPDYLNNYNNFINILRHEYFHQIAQTPIQDWSDHVDVYQKQIQDTTFAKTTLPYKKSIVASAGNYLMNQGNDRGQVDSRMHAQIRSINSVIGKYGFILAVVHTYPNETSASLITKSGVASIPFKKVEPN